MIPRTLACCAIPLSVLILCQCGYNEPGPVLVGQSNQLVAEGDASFLKGEAKEKKGDIKGAIKLYDRTATEFPFATKAGEARFRQAVLLERVGEQRDAFAAYDKFLTHFPSHPQHDQALRRLFEIAMAAKDGTIQTSFLGIKGRLPTDTPNTVNPAKIGSVQMLMKVMGHAPKSDMAAKAQIAIAEAFLYEKKYHRAVQAYRTMVDDHHDHPLAPEALFRVGQILLEDAERGNQNQANLDLSREAFNDYLLQYPGHKRNAEARQMIASLDKREVQRSFDVAEFYYKTKQYEPAKVYYRDVLKRAKSGELHDKANARLKELGN